MKQKLAALFVTVALALCALPMAAFADGATQVKEEAELLTAAQDPSRTVIELTADITLTKPVSFSHKVTLKSVDGSSFTLVAGDKFPTDQNLVTFTDGGTVNNLTLNANQKAKYAIHAYNCAVRVLNSTVSGGAYRGLLVNGANASAEVSMSTFTNNTWAGIEVASSSAGTPKYGCVTLAQGVTSDKDLIQVDFGAGNDPYVGRFVTFDADASYTFPVKTESQLKDALTFAASNSNKIVDLGSNSVTLTADLTVPAGVTLQNGTINTDTSAITLNEGSKLASMTINKTTKTDLNIVKIVGNNAVLEKVNFNGQYVLGDKEVVRGVVPNAGVSGYTIKECSFVGLRQPGYLEGPGSVVNCYTEGTRGWVVTQNHKVDFSGCTFKNNADNNTCNICIIPNNGAANAYTAADLNALSTANSGAYVIHQDNKVALLDGQCLVSSISGASTGTDLQKFATMDGAMAMGTGVNVKLVNDLALDKMLELNVEGMTLDLGGFTVSASDKFQKDANNNNNHLVDITADNVTLKNGTLKAGDKNNHTLNVWNAKGVQLSGLKLDNAASYGGAPLIVGASDVTVNGALKVVTGANSWYGINVDSREVGGDKKGASITVAPNVALEFEGQNPTGIYMENSAGMHGEDVKLSFGSGVTFNSGIANFVPVVVKTGQSATVKDPANAGLQDNGNGTFGLKPAPTPAPTPKPEEPWTPGPTATPAPAQVLDSTPKTGAVSLAVLPLAGLAFAGLGFVTRKREE